MLFSPHSVPITSGSSFPGAYCLAGHKRHRLGYPEASYPAEWYGHSHGMVYPKAIKMEPLNYCYQDEASTVGMNSHQPHVFSTPSVDPFTSHHYPMYHSTVNPFVCAPTAETVYHHQTSIPTSSPNAWSPATANVSAAQGTTANSPNYSISHQNPLPSPGDETRVCISTNPLTPPNSGGIAHSPQQIYTERGSPLTHRSVTSSPASDCHETSYPSLPLQSLSGSIHLPGMCMNEDCVCTRVTCL